MQRRQRQDINYKEFHETGKKVVKNTDVNELSFLLEEVSLNEPDMEKLLSELDIIQDDINDFFDENDLTKIKRSGNALKLAISEIKQLRTLYKQKDRALRSISSDYDTKYSLIYDKTIHSIKDYLLNATEAFCLIDSDDKHQIKHEVEKEALNKEASFQLENVSRQLDGIEDEIHVDLDSMSNDEIIRRRDGLSSLSTRLNDVSKIIPKIINHIKVEEDDNVVTRCNDANSSFNTYAKKVKKLMEVKEIEKEKSFQESKLNIDLGKFKGYDSAKDIYTFKDDFDKIYEHNAPKRLMADILKNNHLADQALSMVSSDDTIDEMWQILINSFGDPKMMLSKKVKKLKTFHCIWKMKDADKIADCVAKLITFMKDLERLCQRHGIAGKLYNGDTIDQVYSIMGDGRVSRWFSSIYGSNLDDQGKWGRLINFLEKELHVQQQKMLISKTEAKKPEKTFKTYNKGAHYTDESTVEYTDGKNIQSYNADAKDMKCSFCGEKGHVVSTGPRGKKLIQYFSCRRFVEMSPAQRFNELKRKKLCFQCLYPGAPKDDDYHKEGRCSKFFSCKHTEHDQYPTKKHLLVCDEHKEENEEMLKMYIEKCIEKRKNLPAFSKTISLSFHTTYQVDVKPRPGNDEDVIYDKAIYQLQTIKLNGKRFNIFYDNGCGDFIVRQSAVKKLQTHVIKEFDGTINIGGVGGIVKQSPHGIYTVKIPINDDQNATMTGVCLERITQKFPDYPLRQVEEDIHNAFKKQNGDASELPRLPKSVGGEMDMMIGIKYLRYHPTPVFQMPSGLTIFKSKFENADGGFGVIGGPHQIFTAIEKQFKLQCNHQSTFLSNQLSIYKEGFQINPDVSLLGYKMDDTDMYDTTDVTDQNSYLSRKIKFFNIAEDTGSEILYRCVQCRNCQKCKNHESTEAISIQEEIEQDLINQSVAVDTTSRSTVASLPFLHDPATKLAPNKMKAMKVYEQQVKKLNKLPDDKDDVIKSEGKLHALGHVDFVKNLPLDQQEMLNNSDVKYYIPWRAVWKSNSVSTPCRVVFDASQATDSGYSLNDILAKGRNSMNKLQEILLRWFTHHEVFHCDVQKMYNSVKLKPDDWTFQRYLWQNNLDPSASPVEKVIKTLIYGVRSSGNQAEKGLRDTAKISFGEFPEAAEIICNDIYVDDCLSGGPSSDVTKSRADELEIVLNRGGFSLKGVTFSSADTPEKLTDDGESVSVAGLKWYPKEDVLMLDIGEMNLKRKCEAKSAIIKSLKLYQKS